MMSSIKWDFILVRTEAGVLKIVRQEDIVFVQGGRSATLVQTTTISSRVSIPKRCSCRQQLLHREGRHADEPCQTVGEYQ